MGGFASNFNLAFRSTWAQVGIILTAFALLNFFARILDIGLAAWLSNVIAAFRVIFHPVVDALTGWMKLDLTPLWKDGITLYLASGGAVARTALALLGTVGNTEDQLYLRRRGTVRYWSGPINRIITTFMVATAFLAWPLTLAALLHKPLVYDGQHVLNNVSIFGMHIYYRTSIKRTADSSSEVGKPACDLRAVFALQLSAIVAVVTTLTIFNGFLK